MVETIQCTPGSDTWWLTPDADSRVCEMGEVVPASRRVCLGWAVVGQDAPMTSSHYRIAGWGGSGWQPGQRRNYSGLGGGNPSQPPQKKPWVLLTCPTRVSREAIRRTEDLLNLRTELCDCHFPHLTISQPPSLYIHVPHFAPSLLAGWSEERPEQATQGLLTAGNTQIHTTSLRRQEFSTQK